MTKFFRADNLWNIVKISQSGKTEGENKCNSKINIFNKGAPCPNRDNLSERQGQFNDQLAAHRTKECNNSDDKNNPKKNCKYPDKIGSENNTIFEVMLCDECGGNGKLIL